MLRSAPLLSRGAMWPELMDKTIFFVCNVDCDLSSGMTSLRRDACPSCEGVRISLSSTSGSRGIVYAASPSVKSVKGISFRTKLAENPEFT